MKKKKTIKSKSSVKQSKKSQGAFHVHDEEFIIIAGGGLVVLLLTFVLFFL